MERKEAPALLIGGRIKKLRKALDLTQAEFGEKIGSTQNAIGNYETGHRNPSSSVINNICKTFNVSEGWLRAEEGEMFLAKPAAALDALAAEYSLSKSDYALIEKFLALKPEVRKAMTDYMKQVVAAIAAEEKETLPAFSVAPSPVGQEGNPITVLTKELAELKRQNAEMAARIAAVEEEDATLEAAEGSSTMPQKKAHKNAPARTESKIPARKAGTQSQRQRESDCFRI